MTVFASNTGSRRVWGAAKLTAPEVWSICNVSFTLWSLPALRLRTSLQTSMKSFAQYRLESLMMRMLLRTWFDAIKCG